MDIQLPVIPLGALTLLALFAPYAIALINHPAWPKATKKAVSIAVPVVLAVVVLAFYYWATGDVIPSWPTLILLAIVTAQASYSLLFKRSAKHLEEATSRGGVHDISSLPQVDE